MWPQTRQMKESTKPRIGQVLGAFAVSGMDKVELRSCEKIEKPGPDTFFAPRNRLKIRNCPARKGLSVPDFSIFSQLLTLGVIWQPQVDRMRNRFSTEPSLALT